MTLSLVLLNHPRHPSLVQLPIKFCIRYHLNQKLTWKGPCGSLSAAINAAAQTSFIEQSVLARRNSLIDDQLKAKKLKVIDILGYGNWFFSEHVPFVCMVTKTITLLCAKNPADLYNRTVKKRLWNWQSRLTHTCIYCHLNQFLDRRRHYLDNRKLSTAPSY